MRGGGGSFQVWFHQNTDVYSSHFFIAAAPLLTRRRTDNCNEETGWGKRPHSSAKPNLEAAPLAPSFLTPHPHKAPLFCSFRFDVAVAAWHLLSTLPLSLSQTSLAAARTERSLSPISSCEEEKFARLPSLPLNVLLPSWVVVRRVLGSLYFPCKMEFVWNRLIILGLVAVVARTEVSFMHT